MSNPQHRPSMTGSNGRPVEFWGLKAIAARLGVSISFLRKLADKWGFPLLLLPNPHRKHKRNLSFKFTYYSNEGLIQNWLSHQIEAQRNLRRKHGWHWWKHLGKGHLTAQGAEKPPHARWTRTDD